MQRFPFVGCAGWSIPAAHRTKFNAGASILGTYASRFDAVEINSSFYRSHQPKTYARWADTVHDGFRFAVKMRRSITHEARLQHAEAMIRAFFGEVSALRDKLGVVLIQLPPSLPFDAATAAAFFATVRHHFDGGVAFEPRHRTWFAPESDALCRRHRVARVAADPPPFPAAAQPGGSDQLRYWRWHGSPRIYYSAYDDDRLRGLATQARDNPGTTWCIFDNTALGHATADALKLRALLAQPIRSRAVRRA